MPAIVPVMPSIVAIGRYARLINDAEFSPIVSVRGSHHQWNGGLELAPTF